MAQSSGIKNSAHIISKVATRPSGDDGILNPSCPAEVRIDRTERSRNPHRNSTQTGQISMTTAQLITKKLNMRSEIWSSNEPSSVHMLCFLAYMPSILSVMPAARPINAAMTGNPRNMAEMLMMITISRMMQSLFGKFDKSTKN